jgi:hypothetical protein
LLFKSLKHPYFKVSQDSMSIGSSNVSAINDSAPVSSARSRDSKQIFTEDWQTDGVIDLFSLITSSKTLFAHSIG